MSNEQLYTYEDIELYMPVMYRGVPGCVVAKGAQVIPGVEKKAVRVALNEKPPGGEGKEYVIAKETVNNQLREKRTLWVDFEWKMSEAKHTTNA